MKRDSGFKFPRIGKRFLAILPVIGAAALLFLFLGAMTGGTAERLLLRWDQGVSAFAQTHRTPILDGVMRFFTALGNWQVVAAGAACAAGFFMLEGDRRRAAFLLLSVIAGGVFVEVMKMAVHRARPPFIHALTGASGFGFPSGHAFVAFSFWCLLLYFLYASFRTAWAGVMTLFCGAVMVLGIGVSRVYLGVHWPSDVLAGWIAGAVWLAVFVAAIGTTRKTFPTDEHR